MKVKKVNEIASDLSKEDIEKCRINEFETAGSEYNLWGESLEFIRPEYIKLNTCYSIKECIQWYNSEFQNPKSRLHKYDNIILTEDFTSRKLLDFELIVNAKKYNI